MGPVHTVKCRCPACENVHDKETRDYYFDDNITHNLSEMAEAAGIYEHLWRPEEIGVEKAGDLVGPLEAGLRRLKGHPGKYRKLNPDNGWGTYEGLVEFVERYLAACEAHPDAEVSAHR
jgi:hypothetical protein